MSPNNDVQVRDRRSVEIAIFCALSLEADAMIARFDETWDHEKCDGDNNSYTLGRIGHHPVLLVHMPRIGKASASSAAANLRLSFPHIRVGLLVGICAGVPKSRTSKRDIILGDVIVGTHIVQTDFGRLYPNGYVRKNTIQDTLGRPSPEIAGFLSKLQGQAVMTNIRDSMREDLTAFSQYPGPSKDRLFESSYIHKHQDTKACLVCAKCTHPEDDVCPDTLNSSCVDLGCDLTRVIPRERIQTMENRGHATPSYCPEVYFGGLASGDQVIKSALHRDRIAEKEDVIGFEMEAAGLWDTIPTIVVKGVCDYADSHKDKEWHRYAAATAAAYVKAMLKIWCATPTTTAEKLDREGLVSSPVSQIFSGNFTAGKNVHIGGTYNANSMSF
ncbi:hypothetical protein N7456_006325 [Penicillium angulare]|uniref:Nucleoside phosphorylase domain-containing protein n=1 Tax=Penicillium angulare TaxID=116970 RepID=A0A9W9KBT5_9EURO|nr:hypothetical protein N7456_006325 [Penicillium angulare]